LVNGSASFSTNLEGYFGVFGCFFAISVFAFFSIMPLLFSYGFFPIAFSIFPRQEGCIVVAFWGRAFAGKSMGQNRDQSGGAIYRFFKLLGRCATIPPCCSLVCVAFLLVSFLPRCFYPSSRDLTIESLLCFALLLFEQKKKPKKSYFCRELSDDFGRLWSV